MKKYYEAIAYLTTEKNGDPQTEEEHGYYKKFEAPSLDMLKTVISSHFFNLEKPIGADVQINGDVLEIRCESDHSVGLMEFFEIVINKVDKTPVMIGSEPLFKDVSR